MNATRIVVPAACAITMACGVAFGQIVLAPASTMTAAPGAAAKADKITCALFVEDATAEGSLTPFLPKLSAELASALNKNGFAIVDPRDHLSISEPAADRTLLTTAVEKDKPENLEKLGAATLVQIARDVGATCYMKASITSLEKAEIAPGIFDLALSLALNAFGAARGDGVYGDTVTIHGRATAAQIAKGGGMGLDQLLRASIDRMAASFATGMADTALKSRPAKFKIICDVPATVKIDGAARGAIEGEETYTVETGLHTIEVMDNPAWPYYQAYRTRVFIEDGAKFTLILYLNDKGVARMKEKDKYAIDHRWAIDNLLYWESFKNDEATRRANAITAVWMDFTNSLALYTAAENDGRANNNKIVASALRNGEKIVDSCIKVQELGKTPDYWRIEGEVETERIHAAGEVGVAEANAEGEVGKAEVQARIDNERHQLIAPIVDGLAKELGNSWTRLEDTRRHLLDQTISQGPAYVKVDYDPEDKTTVDANDPTPLSKAAGEVVETVGKEAGKAVVDKYLK